VFPSFLIQYSNFISESKFNPSGTARECFALLENKPRINGPPGGFFFFSLSLFRRRPNIKCWLVQFWGETDAKILRLR
jgi:hypothetical protein